MGSPTILTELADRVERASEGLLEHYSDRPLETLFLPYAPLGIAYKPNGLWLSVAGDDDWPSWCRAEGFRLDRLAVRHIVDLAPDANVLWMGSGLELDAFTDRFGVSLTPDWCPRTYIDWRAVADAYDGIIIAPYQWSRRHEGHASGWYYPWDCASGCIWRADAIASIRAIAGMGE